MKKMIVLLAALAMVAGMVATAAADVSLYGSIRFRTYSAETSSDWNGTAFDDRDTEWRMGLLSRFGATFTSGDVGGKWEMDARNNVFSDTSHVTGLRLRLGYGYWNFGSGQLLIGQNYPLTDLPISGLNYTSAGMQPWGSLGMALARIFQIRLTFGNLKLAFLSPSTNFNGGGYMGFVGTNLDTILPKIEASYTFKFDPVTFDIVGGWQNYEEINTATDNGVDVTSYVLALRAKANFGAAYLNGIVSWNQNGNDYGIGWNVFDSPLANAAGTDIEDATAYGFALVGGYKISDMFTFEIGYGYMSSEWDGPVAGLDYEDAAFAYYAQLKCTLAPGVYFIPEIMKFDADDITIASVDTDEGDLTVFGAFWKIDFK